MKLLEENHSGNGGWLLLCSFQVESWDIVDPFQLQANDNSEIKKFVSLNLKTISSFSVMAFFKLLVLLIINFVALLDDASFEGIFSNFNSPFY